MKWGLQLVLLLASYSWDASFWCFMRQWPFPPHSTTTSFESIPFFPFTLKSLRSSPFFSISSVLTRQWSFAGALVFWLSPLCSSFARLGRPLTKERVGGRSRSLALPNLFVRIFLTNKPTGPWRPALV